MKQIFIILCLINGVHYAEKQVLAALAPQIAQQYQFSFAFMALLLCGFMIGYIVAAPIISQLSKRHSPFRLILGSIAMGAGAMFSISFLAPSYLVFFASRVVLGMAVASFNCLAPPLIFEKNDHIRTANMHMALFFMMTPLGIGFGFLGGALHTSFTPWQTFFTLGGCVSIILGVLYLSKYPKGHASLHPIDVGTLTAFKELWHNKTFNRLIWGYVFYIGAGNGFLSWVSTYGVKTFEYSLSTINLGLGITTLAAALIGTYIGSRFGGLFATPRTLISGFGLFAAVCIGLATPIGLMACFSTRFDLFLVLILGVEILLFAAHAPMMTSLLSSTPSGLVPVAAGLSVFLVYGVSDIIFCLLFAGIGEQVSWRTMMIALSLCFGVSGWIWYRVSRHTFRASPVGQNPFAITPFVEGCSRFFQSVLRAGARLYFKEVYVYQKDHLAEAQAPTLFIANHPNGLVDILVLYTSAQKTMRFVAKHTLWESAILRPILALGGCIPIFRKQDSEAAPKDKGATSLIADNAHAMRIVSETLSYHNFALYPEGLSHNDPFLSKFKTGGSRMLLNAASMSIQPEDRASEQQTLALTAQDFEEQTEYGIGDFGFQPVGMYFDAKTEFRSRALIHYGERIALKDVFSPDELQRIKQSPEDPELVKKLTDAMHERISTLIPLSETEAERTAAQQTASLMIDPDKATSIKDFFSWDHTVQSFIDILKEKNLELYKKTQRNITTYFENLRAHKISDSLIGFYAKQPNPYRAMLTNQLSFWLFVLCLSPFIAGGLMLYWPWLAIAGYFANKFADGDSELSTYKFLAGAIFGGMATLTYVVVAIAWGWIQGHTLIWVLGVSLFILSSILATLIFVEHLQARLQEFKGIFQPSKRHFISQLAEERHAISAELNDLYSYLNK